MPDIDYTDAPHEVMDLVSSLIQIHPEADFAKARVKYLLKPMKKSKWAGKCCLAGGPWRHLLPDYDYVIVLWQQYWETHNDHRAPLLYHELCHIIRTDAGRWALRQHPIQEFPEVIQEYGCWSPELKCLEPVVRRARRI